MVSVLRDNKPTLILFILYVALLVLFPTGDERMQRGINFQLIMMIGLSWLVFSRFSWSIGAFLLFVSGTMPFHAAIDTGVQLSLISYTLFFLLVAWKEWDRDKLYDAICLLSLFNVAIQGIQIANHGIPCGYLLNNTNETAAFYAMTIWAFFRPRRWYGATFILLGLYWSQGFGVAIVLALVGFIYLYRQRSKLPVKAIILIGLTVCMGLGLLAANKGIKHSVNSGSSRLTYWSDMAPVLGIHPFNGWGMGQFKYVMPMVQTPHKIHPEIQKFMISNIGDKHGLNKARYLTMNQDKTKWTDIWIEAHNDYYQLAMEAGFIALALLLIAIVFVLWQARGIPFYALLSASLCGTFFFPFQIAPIMIVCLIFLGITVNDNLPVWLKVNP